MEIKGQTSTTFKLEKGVPQGSCIGPVLFIIYHYDILEAIGTIHWKHLFADDLAIVISSSASMSSRNIINTLANQIKEILSRLIKYAETRKQPINFSKTYWTLFPRQVKPQIPSITYNGCDILHTTKIKYLGTILDVPLSFSQHID